MQRLFPRPVADTFQIERLQDTFHSMANRTWSCDCFFGVYTGDRVASPVYGVMPRICRVCPIGRALRPAFFALPESEAKLREWKTKRLEATLARSGVHAAFRSIRLTDIDNEPLRKELQKYVTRWPVMQMQGYGFHFWGDIGRGKTHAMMALVNELIEKRLVQVMFLSLPELVNRLRAVVGGNTEDIPLLEEMMECELLVLDDVGMEKSSEWMVEQLYRVVNLRYEEKRPILCTSNQSLNDLARHYTPQIASRLQERCKSIRFAGKNWRDELKPRF